MNLIRARLIAWGMPLCVFGMALYFGSYIYLHFNPAPYVLLQKAEFALTILWGIIVFVINLFVLQLLVIIANSSEEELEYQLSHNMDEVLRDADEKLYLGKQSGKNMLVSEKNSI